MYVIPQFTESGIHLLYAITFLFCSVRDDWTFDEAMAQYGCEVHSFDPRYGSTTISTVP